MRVFMLCAAVGCVLVAQPRTARAADEPANRPRLMTQSGHLTPIITLAIAKNFRVILTADGSTPEAVVWDLTTGRELCRLVGHTLPIRGATISPDSRFALTAGADSTLRLWHLATGREIRQYR